MNYTLKSIGILLLILGIYSCQTPVSEQNASSANQANKQEIVLQKNVLTAQEQSQLTPDAVIGRLKEGNQRFLNNELTLRDNSAQAKNSAKGQYPMAAILSCIDSRVPVEEVFDLGIGDVFVARVAGNIVNEDILGSLEYSCKVSGSKLIVVLGHESCGAVKAAIDGVELGNITGLLSKIKPAIAQSENFDGEHSGSNYAYVNYVGEMNVKESMDEIRRDSPILREMEEKGEIKLVGANYDIHTGAVEFFTE